jgi:cell division protein FtsN
MTTDYKDRFIGPEPPEGPSSPPRWHWVAAGMLVGAFLTWLGTLAPEDPPATSESPHAEVAAPPPPDQPAAAAAKPAVSPVKPATIAQPPPAAIATEVITPQEEEEPEASATPPKPHFEFYTVLPEQEVVVGRSERDTRPVNTATTLPALHGGQTQPPPAGGAVRSPGQPLATVPQTTQPPKPAGEAVPKPAGETLASAAAVPKEGNRFMVQMGSFRTPADAERMRAQMALLGVVAEVQPVTLEKGDKVFRVLSGVVDAAESSRIQQRLKENGVTTMLMRLK